MQQTHAQAVGQTAHGQDEAVADDRLDAHLVGDQHGVGVGHSQQPHDHHHQREHLREDPQGGLRRQLVITGVAHIRQCRHHGGQTGDHQGALPVFLHRVLEVAPDEGMLIAGPVAGDVAHAGGPGAGDEDAGDQQQQVLQQRIAEILADIRHAGIHILLVLHLERIDLRLGVCADLARGLLHADGAVLAPHAVADRLQLVVQRIGLLEHMQALDLLRGIRLGRAVLHGDHHRAVALIHGGVEAHQGLVDQRRAVDDRHHIGKEHRHHDDRGDPRHNVDQIQPAQRAQAGAQHLEEQLPTVPRQIVGRVVALAGFAVVVVVHKLAKHLREPPRRGLAPVIRHQSPPRADDIILL